MWLRNKGNPDNEWKATLIRGRQHELVSMMFPLSESTAWTRVSSLNRLPSKYLSRRTLHMIKYSLTKLEYSSRCMWGGITNCHQTICHQFCYYVRHNVDKVIFKGTYCASKDKMTIYTTKSQQKRKKQTTRFYITHLSPASLGKKGQAGVQLWRRGVKCLLSMCRVQRAGC